MIDAELEYISRYIGTKPFVTIFGNLPVGSVDEQLKALRSVFRQLLKTVHPDRYPTEPNSALAAQATKDLREKYDAAKIAVRKGTYGVVKTGPIILKTGLHTYTTTGEIAHGDECTVYRAITSGVVFPVEIKIPRTPRVNDLMQAEAASLRHLGDCKPDDRRWLPFVASLVQSFRYEIAGSGMRVVNVLETLNRPGQAFYTLEEVHKAYPHGLDPKDMAWMWRRLLIGLVFAHTYNVIHGAVVPSHVMIEPSLHGVVLIDWKYSLIDPRATGAHIKAIVPKFKSMYPKEILDKHVPTPQTDIYMAAKCMMYLVDGVTLHPDLIKYFAKCTDVDPAKRFATAASTLDTFDDIIERLWGPRVFYPFTMPAR